MDGLIVKNDDGYSITNLGGILFAKNLHDFKSLERKIVRVVQYKGNNKLETILKEKNIELPICETVYNILYNKKDPKEELDKLFLRSIKKEFSF